MKTRDQGPYIPHSRPCLDAKDRHAVDEVLRSGQLAQGKRVREFEQRTASTLHQRDGVAVSSGTAGLHLALLGLGVRPGDAVAIPSYTCVALLHSVGYVGARPVIVDLNPQDYNLDPHDLKRRVRRGPELAAAIVPHMFGRVCDLELVREAVGASVPVVEDCAQALGDPSLGTGDVLVCSFYATKMMTTGEGGMVLSRDSALLDRVRDLRDYDEKPDHRLRFNFKMTEMQGALGLSQSRKLNGFVRRRQKLSRRYGREERTCFRFVERVPDAASAIAAFERQGVGARRPVFRALHAELGRPDAEFPETAKAMRSLVSIPLYPALSQDEIDRILNAIEVILR